MALTILIVATALALIVLLAFSIRKGPPPPAHQSGT